MKSKYLVRPLLALALLTLAALACQFGGPPAVVSVTVAKSLDSDYKAVNPTVTFTSEDTAINLSVEVENIEVGNVVEVRYKHDGADYNTLTMTADEAGSGYFGFELTVASGLLPGNYVADVYLNGQLAKSASFNVVPSGPPSIGLVIAAKSLADDYQPVEPTGIYSPSDTFYISVQVKNLTVGSDVTVKYLFNGEFLEESSVIADQAGSGYYGFSLQPSSDGYAAGVYTAEVYLNGVLSGSATFAVQ